MLSVIDDKGNELQFGTEEYGAYWEAVATAQWKGGDC